MDNCVFCRVVKGELPCWKVYEDDDVLAFFDVNPANEYHTLVVPKQHHSDIFDIPENLLISITKAIKQITTTLKDKVGINNLQIVNSSGSEAQQDVFHIHFHIVPRNNEDGQNILWTPKPELKERYNELLAQLQ